MKSIDMVFFGINLMLAILVTLIITGLFDFIVFGK